MGALVKARIESDRPKRILALDGGGVRGIITIAFLEKIEDLLAKRFRKLGLVQDEGDFRLSQYFDLIGGTSVGSLLAVMLARGDSMKQIKEKFRLWAPDIFRRPAVTIPILFPRFSARALERHLDTELGIQRLDSDTLTTAIAVFAKRVDTGSPWVLTNNPAAKYWDDKVIDKNQTIGNRHYKLREILRASTAAPYFFAPTKIRIAEEEIDGRIFRDDGLFVDGGISPFNTPALKLLMVAAVKGFGFNWKLGSRNLLLTSVGTGSYRVRTQQNFINKLIPALLATEALQGVMADTQTHALTLLQWLSDPHRPWSVNSEIGDMNLDRFCELLGAGDSALSFARFDVLLEEGWLREHGLTNGPSGRMSKTRLAQLRDFTDPRDLARNYELGAKAAAKQVDEHDFPAAFDHLGTDTL